jgi:beta-lactamase class A
MLTLLRRAATATTFVVGASLGAQTAHQDILARHFQQTLERIASSTNGVVGISSIDLTDGRTFGVNDTLVFPQGSAIKIAILVELFRRFETGDLTPGDRMVLRAADQVGGSGVSQWFGDSQSALSLHDLAVLMIVLSDNTATNMLIDRLGMARINQTMASLDLGSIRVQRRMIQPLESARGNENVATPRHAALLMRRVASCELPMSRERCGGLRRILELPKGGPFPASVPGSVRVAWKPGGVEGVETAWGLFALAGRPYALAVMVNYSDSPASSRALREVADAAYEYFRRLARSSPHGVRVPLSVADSIRRP